MKKITMALIGATALALTMAGNHAFARGLDWASPTDDGFDWAAPSVANGLDWALPAPSAPVHLGDA